MTEALIFVADDAALDLALPGWARPRATPTRRVARNPFTGRETEVVSWEPDGWDRRVGDPSLDALAPDFVPVEVFDALASLAGLCGVPEAERARPSRLGADAGNLQRIPDAVVARLAQSDPSGRAALAAQWSAIERARASIPNAHTRARLLAALTETFWADVLARLAELAREAHRRGAGLHAWVVV